MKRTTTHPLAYFLPFFMALTLFYGCQTTQEPEKEAPRPNIILILSDDMGYSDIGCYGGEIATPTLDRLASNGLRFSQFYNTGRCCPTRASLLTGLYPAQTGMGMMTVDRNLTGYEGEIGKNCMTIAEVLKTADYNTYMAGKWHVTKDENLFDVDSLKYNWPRQRGFDKFYGTIIGAGSFWDPWTLTRDNHFISPENDPEYQPEGKYYYTHAISDHAVRFIESHFQDQTENPFFMYVAYTAAHWPLHAPEEAIEQYEGKYDAGYQAIRDQRFERMKEMGLIDESWEMSETVGDWETEEDRDWHTRNMETYAAMVTEMDKGIGQMVAALEKQGELDNTIILFLQDNGGCAEQLIWRDPGHDYETLPDAPILGAMPTDELQTKMFPNKTREGYPVLYAEASAMAGPAHTYFGYGPTWANVSNTPFRQYKHWVHEGGVSTPLVVHWPAQITEKGTIRHQPGHLIDIMATCVELAGAEYPSEYQGHSITPMAGKSLVATLTENAPIQRDAIYFEHQGNRGMRQGKWKLVSKAHERAGHYQQTDEIPFSDWALFDMEADRTEMHDLSAQHPERVKKMAEAWQRWAVATYTVPKPK